MIARRMMNGRALLALVATAGAVTALHGTPALATTIDDEEPWLRTVEVDGASLALEVAVRRFRPTDDSTRPDVTLVGVAHVADGALYGRLQTLLDEHDLVLFESVVPTGARGSMLAPGDARDDATRAATTRASLAYAASLAATVAAQAEDDERHERIGNWDVFLRSATDLDSRHGASVRGARRDAWGRPVELLVRRGWVVGEDGTDRRSTVGWALTSLGADGEPGGAGADADIVVALDDAEPLVGPAFNLQKELADALRLAFQLTEIDYDRDGWIVADMELDEFTASAEARGADVGAITDQMGGIGLGGGLARALLWLVRLGDMLSSNMVTDLVKAVMIEMLASPAVEATIDEGLGAELAAVILHDRNDIVLGFLDQALEADARAASTRGVESIAIFYGAAHMRGLADGLVERGYEAGETEWVPAITLDLSKSKLDPVMLEAMRRQVQRTLERMPRGAGR